MLLRWGLFVFLLIAIAYAVPAHAECQEPSAFTSPASGSTIPVNGEILVFEARFQYGQPPTVSVEGARAKVSYENNPGGLLVTRIKLVTTKRREVTVRARGKVIGTFKTSVSWRKGPTPRLGLGVGQVHRWTCSHTNTYSFPAQNAAQVIAYELSYPNKQNIIVPPEPMRAFAVQKRNDKLVIGHVSCLGHTAQMRANQLVQVTAVLADGSRIPIGKKQLR